ncbi:DUF6088 family protein [Chitinophaga qingshengii]|uniref:Type IV toxin-antitoxin system AbiEi family antitoxin domain-containing protein n=1 Tax=Chitinophaga qingshengii TaxID=1569794 RepID=A0ABR7TN47_9BACT|nr:DUF6088 family protein [Chitinophaga qingshengii]MBC9930942.1 hypothetical protein [Chitinophaga qingshengii]
MKKVHTQIEQLIARKKPGALIFPTDFRGLGTETAIKQALFRMVRNGMIRRLTHGIYYTPKKDEILGELIPGVEEVAAMIAKKERVHIVPSGADAMNRLGLSTQVPLKLVYLTDGPPRKFKVGNLEVRFKATTPKRVSRKGKISSLVILALEETNLQQMDDLTKNKIKRLLEQEDPQKLKHDLSLAPVRVNDFIVNLFKFDTTMLK